MDLGDTPLDVAIKQTAGLARITTSESPHQYTVSTVQKFGRNSEIDTNTDPEDVWMQGGVFVPPTQARVHDIAGGVNDDAGGTGALTVTVSGLDGDGLEVSETVTMDGTTNVATSNSYTHINRMVVTSAGSNGTNVAAITATAAPRTIGVRAPEDEGAAAAGGATVVSTGAEAITGDSEAACGVATMDARVGRALVYVRAAVVVKPSCVTATSSCRVASAPTGAGSNSTMYWLRKTEANSW